PAASLQSVMLPDEILYQGEHQREGMLGDSVVVGAGRGRDGNATLCGRGDVDRIETDADTRDHLEVRVGLNHAPGVRFRSGDAGVDAFQCGQQLIFGHLRRPRRIDQLETASAKRVHEFGVQPGQRHGSDQSFRHWFLCYSSTYLPQLWDTIPMASRELDI